MSRGVMTEMESLRLNGGDGCDDWDLRGVPQRRPFQLTVKSMTYFDTPRMDRNDVEA